MICYQFDTINDIWFCCFDLKLQRWGWSEDRDLTRETSLLVDDLSVTIITTRKMPVWFAGLLKRQETLNVSFLFCLLSQNIRRNFPRMLGYSDGQHTTNSQFGPVSTAFRMDDVQCTGNEASLLDCPHNPRHNCGSHEGAGVICSNSSNSGRLKSFWKNVGCVS